MNLIVLEVHKFCQTKRITNQNILELDKKIAYEIYLKEKKEAIIEDRKDEEVGVQETNTESTNLEKVRTKYENLTQQITQDTLSKKSMTFSQKTKSICGSV